ncbi:MAG: hypothetical protein NT157_05920 [Candidatus Micrarchaeota archaeon]|nr:hypothetical protein [Candidatus Micrarchaeota archaeon]
MSSSRSGGVGSVVGYISTFLATLAVLIIVAVIWNYMENPGMVLTIGQHFEFLNSVFFYLAAFSAIVVLGEIAYKAPRRGKRKRDADEEDLPPYKV